MQKYLSLSFIPLFALFNWVLFTDEAGAFRILTPGNFTQVTQEVNTLAGKTLIHTFYCFPAVDSSQYYSISYYDIDSTDLVLNDSFANALLYSIKESLLQSFYADEAYSTTLDLKDGYGLFFRAGYNEAHNVMKCQIRFYPPRVYVLQALLPHQKAMDNEVQRFFDSFERL